MSFAEHTHIPPDENTRLERFNEVTNRILELRNDPDIHDAVLLFEADTGRIPFLARHLTVTNTDGLNLTVCVGTSPLMNNTISAVVHIPIYPTLEDIPKRIIRKFISKFPGKSDEPFSKQLLFILNSELYPDYIVAMGRMTITPKVNSAHVAETIKQASMRQTRMQEAFSAWVASYTPFSN